MPTNFPVSVSVSPTSTINPGFNQTLLGLLADALTATTPFPFPFAALGLTGGEALLCGQSDTEAWRWGRVIQETLKVHIVSGPQMLFHATLAQVVSLANVLTLALPVTLTQAMTVHQTQSTALGLILLQHLKVLDGLTPDAVYHLALSQALHINSALGRFYGATLTQAMGLSPTLASQYRAVTSLIQNVTIASALANSLSIHVSDDMGMTDVELLQALYQDNLADKITVNMLYVSPSGFATTWVVNTRTNAVTEYRNYSFTGFAQMGLKYIACDQNGLYELDGPKDLNASIVAEIETGFMQLNNSRLGGLKGLYLGMDAQGEFVAKIETGDGREYCYRVVAQPGLETTKINVGKGIRSRYLSFKLVSMGPDFRLDTIEFVPMRSDRRV